MIQPWEIKKNREDVVQAALVVERWCKNHQASCTEPCDCPFYQDESCFVANPHCWHLEEALRARGVKNEE